MGTVRRLELPESIQDGHLSPHTAGFGAALAVARKLGLAVPGEITLCCAVIREPPCFTERLSPELEARLDEIARHRGRGVRRLPASRAETGPDRAGRLGVY